MEELVLCILEPVFEVILEGVGVLGDLLLSAIVTAFQDLVNQNAGFALLGYLVCGLILGSISLGLFPHLLMHPLRSHGRSLLIGPVMVGLMMLATGAILRRHDQKTALLEEFGYGFALVFGIALIRIFLVK